MLKKEVVVGIDLGGTYIKGALLDIAGTILVDDSVSTGVAMGHQHVVEQIILLVKTLWAKGQINADQVLGIGIGVPGLPNYDNGKVIFAPNLQWNNVPLGQPLQEALGLPVFLDNDANAAALGEQWCGAGRGAQHMVLITIGTGIGSGLILEGKIYRGADYSAGEIGHITMDPQGPPCNCGRRGCLENFTSATAIQRMAQQAVDEGRDTLLRQFPELTAKEVCMSARQGDAIARQIIHKVAFYLGWAIGNLVNTLNPQLVLLGGGVACAGELLFEPIRQRVQECTLEVCVEKVRIEAATLGNKAGSIGAGALVLDGLNRRKPH